MDWPNTILVSCIGTLGVVSLTYKVSQFNQQINAVLPFEDYHLYFSFFALKDLKEVMEAVGDSSTMGNISKSKFENLKIILPSSSLAIAYFETVSSSFHQIRVLQEQNKKLQQARDLLLPKLMTGEIVV